MQAMILSIGSELTTGQTLDTNAAWLSEQLAAIGVRTTMHVTIADERELIQAEMTRACELADVVMVTGGLGPTEDDLTRQALAAAMGVDLELREEFVEQIRAFFAARRLDMPEANLIQAMFPVGTEPIVNTCGTAPGIRVTLKGAMLFIMPGVPREMKVMFERDVASELTSLANGAVLLKRVLWTYGAGESDIGERIRDLMQRGRNPTVGTTAHHTVIGVRIHSYGKTQQAARALLDEATRDVRQRLGNLVFGQDDDTLADAVARLLTKHKKTVSTAESCTGGLIAKSLTDVPGSSDYMLEGVVTYSNTAKVRLLHVPVELIERHGAVSVPVAEAMAKNGRRLSASDYALSVTGIAGPTGGTATKPIGLVYVGLADNRGCQVTERRFGTYLTREEIRDRTRKLALNCLRLRLLEAK